MAGGLTLCTRVKKQRLSVTHQAIKATTKHVVDHPLGFGGDGEARRASFPAGSRARPFTTRATSSKSAFRSEDPAQSRETSPRSRDEARVDMSGCRRTELARPSAPTGSRRNELPMT